VATVTSTPFRFSAEAREVATDPRRVIGTAQKALTMLDNGAVEWLCAGHFLMVPSNDPKEVRASLQRIVGQAGQFSEAIEKEFAAHPED
jgi:hypothetical protein